MHDPGDVELDHPIWRQVTSGALTIAIALTVAFGLHHKQQPAGAKPRFCTADGYIADDGEVYGRNPDFGCKFVDDEGKPIPGVPAGGGRDDDGS